MPFTDIQNFSDSFPTVGIRKTKPYGTVRRSRRSDTVVLFFASQNDEEHLGN